MVTLLELYKRDIESMIATGKKDVLPIATLNQFDITLSILFKNAKKSIKIFDDTLSFHSLESYKALKYAYENNSNLSCEVYLKYNCVSTRVRDEFLTHNVYIICNVPIDEFIPYMILVDDKFLIVNNEVLNNKRIIVYNNTAIDEANENFKYIKNIVYTKS